MIERELKFRIPSGGDAAALRLAVEGAGFTLEPTGTIAHEDRYLDTDDWMLYRGGLALRLRQEGMRLRLEAKSLGTAGEAGMIRTEWSQDAPASDPPWTALKPGPVAGLLTPLVGLQVLERLRVRARVHNDRECFAWRRGETRLGLLTIDHVAATDSRYDEVEVELGDGAEEALLELRRAVEARTGFAPSTETKLAASLAASGERLPEREERYYALLPADRLVDVAHKTFGRHFGRLVWNEPGTRLGIDPEFLHDMRVASRRLRTALEIFVDAYPEEMRVPFARALRRIGRGLGRVRDLDVGVERVAALANEAPAMERPALAVFRQWLEIRRARRRLELVERLDSERYHTFLARATAWVVAGPPPASSVAIGGAPAYAVGSRLIGDRMRALHEAFERAEGTLEAGDLHAVRIAAKHARYALEYLADLEGPGAKARAKRLAGLQDFLGEHQDAVMLLRRMRRYARSVPKRDSDLAMSVGAAMGHLERAIRVRRTDLHRAWEKAIGD